MQATKTRIKMATVELRLTREQSAALRDAAVLFVDAKRAVYEALYVADPVRYVDALDLRRRQATAGEKAAGGARSLKLPDWIPEKSLGTGSMSTYDVALEVFKRSGRAYYSYVANQAEQDSVKDYRRWRQDIRKHKRNVPNPNSLSFRVRDKGWRLSHLYDDRFVIELRLIKDEPLQIPFRTRTMSDEAHECLLRIAAGNARQAAVILSSPFVRDFRPGIQCNKKKVWSLCIPVSVADVKPIASPVAGRQLLIIAPESQDDGVFLECRIPGAGYRQSDYVESVSGHDLAVLRQREQAARRIFGRHWTQTPLSASHGRGRKRARQGLDRRRARYANARDNWIGNTSKYLVDLAVKKRCSAIRMEDLTQRDPELLRPGAFAYYAFQEAIRQKATAAGLSFTLFVQSSQAFSDAMAAQDESCVLSGVEDGDLE